MDTWTSGNPLWAMMDPYQRAAAMAIMEAGKDTSGAVNVLGAMVNRARKENQDLGQHVSRSIYQPAIEPSQEARLSGILKDPRFGVLSDQAKLYWSGEQDVPHSATHFLAKPDVMVRLTQQDPQKYRTWPQWTGYDPSTNTYRNQVFADNSHSFINPNGGSSASSPRYGNMEEFLQQILGSPSANYAAGGLQPLTTASIQNAVQNGLSPAQQAAAMGGGLGNLGALGGLGGSMMSAGAPKMMNQQMPAAPQAQAHIPQAAAQLPTLNYAQTPQAGAFDPRLLGILRQYGLA